MSEPVKKTPQEWSEEEGLFILDPDGWRSDDAPDWNEPITREEFLERAGVSTVLEHPTLTPKKKKGSA